MKTAKAWKESRFVQNHSGEHWGGIAERESLKRKKTMHFPRKWKGHGNNKRLYKGKLLQGFAQNEEILAVVVDIGVVSGVDDMEAQFVFINPQGLVIRRMNRYFHHSQVRFL